MDTLSRYHRGLAAVVMESSTRCLFTTEPKRARAAAKLSRELLAAGSLIQH
jgi:hypothetical protein